MADDWAMTRMGNRVYAHVLAAVGAQPNRALQGMLLEALQDGPHRLPALMEAEVIGVMPAAAGDHTAILVYVVGEEDGHLLVTIPVEAIDATPEEIEQFRQMANRSGFTVPPEVDVDVPDTIAELDDEAQGGAA